MTKYIRPSSPVVQLVPTRFWPETGDVEELTAICKDNSLWLYSFGAGFWIKVCPGDDLPPPRSPNVP
jgi:hypothetical protein